MAVPTSLPDALAASLNGSGCAIGAGPVGVPAAGFPDPPPHPATASQATIRDALRDARAGFLFTPVVLIDPIRYPMTKTDTVLQSPQLQ